MNQSPQQVVERELREQQKPLAAIAGSSALEGLTGLGAAVLAILGLLGILPALMLTIGGIALGVSLLIEGGAVAGGFAAIMREAETRAEMGGMGGGATLESLGGLGGLVLSVLALLGVNPSLLMPIAVIAIGAGMLFGSGAVATLNAVAIHRYRENVGLQRVAAQMVSAAADIKMLVGLGAVALGILALLDINSLTLSFVAILSVGASMFLDASTISGRVGGLLAFRRQ